jgi:hypothetical protein
MHQKVTGVQTWLTRGVHAVSLKCMCVRGEGAAVCSSTLHEAGRGVFHRHPHVHLPHGFVVEAHEADKAGLVPAPVRGQHAKQKVQTAHGPEGHCHQWVCGVRGPAPLLQTLH